MLALETRYPDDTFPELDFNAPLSLFRLGRIPEAVEALTKARDTWPLAHKYLLAKQPRKPKAGSNPYGVTVGSPEESWLYYKASKTIGTSQRCWPG